MAVICNLVDILQNLMHKDPYIKTPNAQRPLHKDPYKMPTGKATGIDDISPRLLKAGAIYLSRLLT